MARVESKAGADWYGYRPGASVRSQVHVESRNDPLWIARQIRAGRLTLPEDVPADEPVPMEMPSCRKSMPMLGSTTFALGFLALGGLIGQFIPAKPHPAIGAAIGVGAWLLVWQGYSVKCRADNPEWFQAQMEAQEVST
jgi:hypothetical protein